MKNEINNETAQEGRLRLLLDNDFLEAWTALLSSPEWQRKGPGVILMHLDKLAKYPTDFATYLVNGAACAGLSYVVPDNAVESIFDTWKFWKERSEREARRNLARGL